MDKKVFSIVAVVIVLAVIGVIGYVQPWQNGTTTEGAVPSSPASSPLTGASVADIADTVEEAFARIKKLITFHLESLRKEDKTIPLERGESEFVATARIPLSV